MDKFWGFVVVVVFVVVCVWVDCVVGGILEDVVMGLGFERVLWWEIVDVIEVVIVVVIDEWLIGEWRCFFWGRMLLILYLGFLMRVEMSWCVCCVVLVGFLENVNYKMVWVKM